jgi:hypothetical protein
VAEVLELQLLQKWLQVLNISFTPTELPAEVDLPSMRLSVICAQVDTAKKMLNLTDEALSLLKLFLLLDAATSQFRDRDSVSIKLLNIVHELMLTFAGYLCD